MEIYILRHGVAEPRAAGKADSDRALTAEGRAKLKRVLLRAQAAKVAPSLILTSPFVRALQTAEIAAQALSYRGRIVRTNALRPEGTAAAVWQEVRKYSPEHAILLSGHEPLLGEVFSYLLGATWTLVDLKKGALARIDVETTEGQPRGLLRWLLTAQLSA